MKYAFHCYHCAESTDVDSPPFVPPKAPDCPECRLQMDRVYGCQIDTSGCKDADDVAPKHRIAVSEEANISSHQVAAIEAGHRRHIEERRKLLRDGGNQGSFRHTMSIPAALHAAKIRETGDSRYWEDPKNRARHRSCKVD